MVSLLVSSDLPILKVFRCSGSEKSQTDSSVAQVSGDLHESLAAFETKDPSAGSKFKAPSLNLVGPSEEKSVKESMDQ
jgi:hypothetical protein